MKALIIFDETSGSKLGGDSKHGDNLYELLRSAIDGVAGSDDSGVPREDHVFLLFPLTSDTKILTDVTSTIKASSQGNITILDSAAMLNNSANILKKPYLKFVADLPDKVVRDGKNLKELFKIDEQLSQWWLTLIAEKNTFKSDSFNRLCQLFSVLRAADEQCIDMVVCFTGSSNFNEAVMKNAAERNIKYFGHGSTVNTGNAPLSAPKILRKVVSVTLRTLAKTFVIKYSFKAAVKRLASDSLMLTTYFPNHESAAAAAGKYKNNYFPYLQDELENTREINWLFFYVQNDRISLKDALAQANTFKNNGYRITFLENLLNLSQHLNALRRCFKSALIFRNLEDDIRSAHRMTVGRIGISFYPLFRNDWRRSFTGDISYLGFLYHEAFLRLYRILKPAVNLYLCEMHFWEKALAAAKNTVLPQSRLLGYQNGTVSPFLLNYHNDPAELRQDMPFPYPLPDKIICNGDQPLEIFQNSGWAANRVAKAEALRYYHLRNALKDLSTIKKDRVVIPLSINEDESTAILRVCAQSMKELSNIEFIVKPHPFLNFANVMRKAGLETNRDAGETLKFKIASDPIEELFRDARIAIVGESGTSVEALAFGCKVVVCIFPEFINMSPLAEADSPLVKIAGSSQELTHLIDKMITERHDPEDPVSEARKLVNYFFDLPEEDKPNEFLKIISNN